MSQWNGRIKEVSEFHLRHYCKTKISRGSGHYFRTYWQDTGFAKWNELYEWFIRFSGCWINSQWKFPRYQSTSVIPTSSNSWRNAQPFYRNAEPQRRAAMHFGHTWYIWKRFCKSKCVIFSTLPAGIESLEFQYRRAASFIHSGKEWEANTRSEMPVWTVNQKSCHLQWRRLFRELWGRPTTTADFGFSFRQIHYTSHVCLLEFKIQDWGMYLFTISFGSCALDQRSGDGWFSGWFNVFVINKRNSNAKFWRTRCEDCFSNEQNHP